MKKIIATLALVLAVLSVVSCGGKEIVVEGIEISGYKTEFVVGDSFDKGALVVNAVYTDESTKDVTAEATVTAPATFDAAGSYVVKVAYDVFEELYQVNVAALPNASYETVEAAVNAAVENADKVNGGSLVLNQYSESTMNYTFGANHTVIDQVDDGYIYHYEDLGDDAYFGFYTDAENSYFGKVEGITANHLAGPEVYQVILGQYFYGAEGLVSGLYALATEAGQDLVESVVPCDICGDETYTFSFGYLNADYNFYYIVKVEFVLDRAGALTSLDVVSKYYTETYTDYSYDWSIDAYSPEDVYNYEINEETGLVELDPYANYSAEVTAVYTQTVGERTAVNEYPYAEVMYESFDLQDVEGNAAPATYTVDAGATVNLVIANALPSTAVAGLNEVICECDIYGCWGSVDGNNISISMYNPGTHNITITVGNIVKEITIVVNEPQPEEVSTLVFGTISTYWGDEPAMVYGSSVSVVAGETTYVGAIVNPLKANQEVTLALKEAYTDAALEDVASNDYSAPYPMDPDYNDITMKSFTSNTPGTYVVVATSAVDSTITAEITITVTEEATETPVATFAGTWTALNPSTGKTVATIEANADNTATFSDGINNIVIGWAVEGTTVTFTVPQVYAGTLAITDATVNAEYTSMTATVTINNGEPITLTFTKPGAAAEEEATIEGDWKGTFPFSETMNIPCDCTLTLNADGTGSGEFNGQTVTFSYSTDNGTISFTDVQSSGDITFTIGTYALDFSEMIIYLSTGVQATLTK